jgi:hypothetical protein
MQCSARDDFWMRAVLGRRRWKSFGEQLGHLAAVVRQCDDRHVAFVRGLDRFQHAGRIAAGGDGNKDVAVHAQGAHLLGEDLVVVVIVGDGGEHRGVGGQRDGG